MTSIILNEKCNLIKIQNNGKKERRRNFQNNLFIKYKKKKNKNWAEDVKITTITKNEFKLFWNKNYLKFYDPFDSKWINNGTTLATQR